MPLEQVEQRQQRLHTTARRKQQRVSQRALDLAEWSVFVTNIPVEMLSPQEALRLGCSRWQIECLFRLWQSEGQLDDSRSQNPHRVWCEFYAKLLALLIQHWITVVGCWQRLNRSLHYATRVIRKRAFCLLDALTDLSALTASLQHTAQIMTQTCYLPKRAAHPLTFQGWLEAAHG